jgi:hypothetical protein
MAKARATVKRRNYEYDHHYGLKLAAVGKTGKRAASSGGKAAGSARKAKSTKPAAKR